MMGSALVNVEGIADGKSGRFSTTESDNFRLARKLLAELELT